MTEENRIQKALTDFQIVKGEYGKPDDGVHSVDIGELYYWACKFEELLRDASAPDPMRDMILRIAKGHDPSTPDSERALNLLQSVCMPLDYNLEIQPGSATHRCIQAFLGGDQPSEKPGNVSKESEKMDTLAGRGQELNVSEQPDDCMRAFDKWSVSQGWDISGPEARMRRVAWNAAWKERYDPILKMVGSIAKGQMERESSEHKYKAVRDALMVAYHILLNNEAVLVGNAECPVSLRNTIIEIGEVLFGTADDTRRG